MDFDLKRFGFINALCKNWYCSSEYFNYVLTNDNISFEF